MSLESFVETKESRQRLMELELKAVVCETRAQMTGFQLAVERWIGYE